MATRTIDVDGIEDDNNAKDSSIGGEDAERREGVYAGQGAYKEYVNKRVGKVTQSNAGGLRAGPLRGQTTARISTRFDYQQDICKDYKDSGTCGFGDSCIYMHDRGDYKTGWQLELEWEAEQKAKEAARSMNRFVGENGVEDEEEVAEDDDVPTECGICGLPFKEPIVTRCGHFFCESCALKHHQKSSKCHECNQPTNGVFNAAKELKAKLAEKKRKVAEREEEIRKRVQEQTEEDDV
ncbi:hypothetical protein BC830DRAFT_1066500 [Chytriomyces sp. MP71]|nr:hypothetical protein BC830DRAFT_1066500 [Chytriomyces sp. MP71]